LKIVHFNKFFPHGFLSGEGWHEGSAWLLTDKQVAEFHLDLLAPVAVVAPVPEDKLLHSLNDARDIASVGFYYPAGIGDAMFHTAIVHEIRDELPGRELIVASNDACAPVWTLNPHITGKACRKGCLPLSLFNHVSKWIIGEDVLYRLKDASQGNCYTELHKAFHLPGKYYQPELYKTLHEELAVEKKINKAMPLSGHIMDSVIFSSMSNRRNRSLGPNQAEIIAKTISRRFSDNPILLLDQHKMYFDGMEFPLPLLSCREFLIAVSLCKAVVTVDTATLHAAAAWKKPTLALMGPFSPAMRTTTYPTVTVLWDKANCPQAPCCWHDTGSAPDCDGTAGSCFILDSVTPEKIIKFLERHL
jgi:hypothetical protein